MLALLLLPALLAVTSGFNPQLPAAMQIPVALNRPSAPVPTAYRPQQQQQQVQYAPQAPAAPAAPAVPMNPHMQAMRQMAMMPAPNMQHQQQQAATQMVRNNPQMAAMMAHMNPQFRQQVVQPTAPVAQPAQVAQPQQVQSPFMPITPQQMAQFQAMFGAAKGAAAPAAPAAPQGPPPIDRNLSPCQYTLRNTPSTSPSLSNAASGFTLKSRSRSQMITAGKPVEVSIAPFSKAYQGLNFTSFIIYAKPTSSTPTSVPEYMREFLPPASPTSGRMVGVFQVFKRFAAEAGSMKCSPLSKQEDSVGAYEDLILPAHHAIPARNKVSFLWWPTAEALKYTEIVFTANIKSEGRWYSLKSTPWKVNRPIDIQARNKMMWERYQHWMEYFRKLERQLENPAAAAK